MMMDGRSSKQAFTASQWQELEHQALIFKYISSGMPIPSDLIINMKRMLNSTISSPSLTFALQPSIGWGCYLGSRKAEDPEPWRCRRTDGKKWRCSKEAHVDSKYCERHMHRGKNRSRKPVEISVSPLSSSHKQTNIYPYPRPPGSTGFQTSFSDNNGNHRHINGGKDAFIPPVVTEGRSPFQFKPLTTSSYNSTTDVLTKAKEEQHFQFKPLTTSSYNSTTDVLTKAEEEQHCFVLGADFKLGKSVEECAQQPLRPVLGADFKLRKSVEEGAQQPLRPFFDEWPQKTKNSWVDVEEGYSKTQLSMSTPIAYHHRT